jgi:hypothetical protein
MDINNAHLKQLIDNTDEAFKQLMREPSSGELNDVYESAKVALNNYLTSVRRLSPVTCL